MKEFVINGTRVHSIETFYDEIERALIPGVGWGRNLDAFDDILRGGFGTPEEGFVLKWNDSALSKERLGYPETVRQLELRLKWCHPSARERVLQEIEDARQERGATAFDWLVEIMKCHSPSGSESESNVCLILD